MQLHISLTELRRAGLLSCIFKSFWALCWHWLLLKQVMMICYGIMPGSPFTKRNCLIGLEILIINLIQLLDCIRFIVSSDHLRFIMWIPAQVRWWLFADLHPWVAHYIVVLPVHYLTSLCKDIPSKMWVFSLKKICHVWKLCIFRCIDIK